MGEYAQFKGEQIKIGTCEDMYYIRFDQRRLVQPVPHSLDPVAEAEVLRFRFPLPSEDGTAPGHYTAMPEGLTIPGYTEAGGTHHPVHFSGPNGYGLSMPCPEGPEFVVAEGGRARIRPGAGADGLRVTLNGSGGRVQLVAHRYRPELGRLVPVLRCGGCGCLWRLEDQSEVDALTVACRAEAARCGRQGDVSHVLFWHAVADRISPLADDVDALGWATAKDRDSSTPPLVGVPA